MPEQTVSLHEGSVAVVPQKAEKKSGKRIGFNYIILKSLKESKKNDVVKCIYIKGITSFGLCVIKEGSQGDTKDANGRDIQDRLKWQRTLHERLAKKVRMPKFLDSFEENGNYYLVIEYIKGKPLYDFVRKNRSLRRDILEKEAAGLKVLQYLKEVVKILEELHKHNIVHRDVTLNNFMVMPSGKVAVIDMELSYSLGEQFPAPPFALGTHGYMSPEQEAVSTPTIKEDIFSIGAILLHVWSGISPFKLVKVPGEQFQRAINFFVEDESMVELISCCTQRDAGLRPDTADILKQLKEYERNGEPGKPRPVAAKTLYTISETTEIIQRGILGLADTFLCDKERGWFADHLSQRSESSNDIHKAWYASFNRGVSGVLYFLSRAYAMGYDLSPVELPVQQGFDLIKAKYLNADRNSAKPGFYFGADGIAMSLAEVYRNGWLDADAVMMPEWAYLLSGTTEGLNLSEGWAGQGIAHLACAGLVEGTREKYFAEELMNQQRPEGNWQLSAKGRILFIENGQAGIIYFLLQYGASTGDKAALRCAAKGLEYLMNNAVKADDAVYWRNRHRSANYRWNEGNPGMALVFLKAYEVIGERVYGEWAERALAGIIESRLWASLSMCQGMAGLGETYLEAAKVLGDDKWLAKADDCVQVIMHMQQQARNSGAFWYVERERHPVGNIYVGNAGVMHFLLRFLHPGRFSFPGF